VHCPGGLNREGILRALSKGRAVTTDGPFAHLTVSDEHGRKVMPGDDAAGGRFTVGLSARSSSDFGALERIDLFRGSIGGRERRIRSYRRGRDFDQRHEVVLKTHLEGEGRPAYLRAEAASGLGDRARLAMTNPVWLNIRPREETDGGRPRSGGDGGAER
jgi:hypothetical protein